MSSAFDIKALTYKDHLFEDYNKSILRDFYGDFTKEFREWSTNVFPNVDSEKEFWFDFLISMVRSARNDSDFVSKHAESLALFLPFILCDENIFKIEAHSTGRMKKTIKHMVAIWKQVSSLSSYCSFIRANLKRSDGNGLFTEKSEQEELSNEIKSRIYNIYKQYYAILTLEKNKAITRQPELSMSLANLANQNMVVPPVLPSIYALHALTILTGGKTGKKQDLLSRNLKHDGSDLPVDILQIRQSSCALMERTASELKDIFNGIYHVTSPKGDKDFEWSLFFYGGWVQYDSPVGERARDYFTTQINFKIPMCKIRKVVAQLKKCCELDSCSCVALLKELPNLLYYVGKTDKRQKIIFSIIKESKEANRIEKVVEILRKFCSIEYYLEEDSKKFTQKALKQIKELSNDQVGFLKTNETHFWKPKEKSADRTVWEFLDKFFAFKDVNKDILTCYGLSQLPLMEVKEHGVPMRKMGKRLLHILADEKYSLICPIKDEDIEDVEKIGIYFQGNVATISECIFKNMTLEDALTLIDTYENTGEEEAMEASESVAWDLLEKYLESKKVKLNKYILQQSFPLLSKRALALIGNDCLSIFYQATLYTFGFYSKQ